MNDREESNNKDSSSSKSDSENATDKENIIRFALLSEGHFSSVKGFIENTFPNCRKCMKQVFIHI